MGNWRHYAMKLQAERSEPPKAQTRLEALARGEPLPEGPCCPFHATGGHPEDRHGFDEASVVYGSGTST